MDSPPAEVEYASESMLMRTCGHLYISFALESLATTIMSLVFSYLLLLVTNRGRLTNPGKAAVAFITTNISSFYNDVHSEVSNWHKMAEQPLPKRFGMCRKANQAICMFQLAIGVLTVERWLHISNVNGFRYLGYAVTCPPMQTELIVLIAPVVPFYRLQCYFTYLIVTTMLLAGYSASLISGEVYHGSVSTFLSTWDFSDLQLTGKGCAAMYAGSVLSYLTCIQLPYLATLYSLRADKADLPHGYLKLLLIVGITWLAFPCWWCLSYEGLNLIQDTKMNAVGFAVLNVISKGGFTLQMLSMVAWHRRETKRKEALERGLKPSAQGISLFSQETRAMPKTPDPTGRRDTWVVEMLRPFDIMEGNGNWRSLDPNFRAFLVGRGVAPAAWNNMGDEHRNSMKESYTSTFELMLSDCVDAPAELPSKFPTLPPPTNPSSHHTARFTETISSEGCASGEEGDNSLSLRDIGMSELKSGNPQVPLQPQTPKPQQRTPETGRLGGDRVHEAPEKLPACNLRVNQTVTTSQGQKGRVTKILGKEVEMAVHGSSPQDTIRIRIDDLTLLKVVFTGARGLRAADPTGEMQLSCSALVNGLPSTQAFTPQKTVSGSQTRWNDVVELYGFGPGHFVTLRLWGENPGRGSDQVLLGEAKVESRHIAAGDYEGEIRLQREDGRQMQTYLSIMVVAVNLPAGLRFGNYQEHL